jgi:hypothetical protein
MLNEVRKEAFSMRKTRTINSVDDEEEEDNEETSSNSLVEEWETWYPQEWIGWVMFGTPAESPTEHWVNQQSSHGPTDVEHYFTDEKGSRRNKNPPG